MLPDGRRGPTELDIVGGRIVAVRPLADDRATAWTLVPGFVDLQVNGIGAVDVARADGDDWSVLDDALVSQGVTAWCPTLVSAPLDRYPAPLAASASKGVRASSSMTGPSTSMPAGETSLETI